MNAGPEKQFDEEPRNGEGEREYPVGDNEFQVTEEGVVERPESVPSVDEALSELNESTEISGQGVPEPVSANRHINQPLVEPAPYVAPSAETVAAEVAPSIEVPGAPAAEPFTAAEPVATVPPVQQPYYTAQYPAQVGYADPYATGQQSPYYPVEPVPEPIIAPEKGSNRVFGLLFSVLGVIVYAGLLLGALILLGVFTFILTGGLANLTDLMFYPNYYLAVLGFAVVYILLGLLGNRAGWWLYVYGGYFTALGALAGYLIGRFWEDTVWFGEATIPDVLLNNLFAPTAVAVLILGREVPIWIGSIVAARGRKLKERYEKEHAAYLEELNNTQQGA